MRILIIGNGGREHTLLWKLARDRPDAEFFATQPNGGMLALCKGVEIAPGDLEALTGWAAARGHSILELAMSWLATNDLVASVITGATKPEQIRANVAAAAWDLTTEDRAEVGELLSSLAQRS